MTVPDADGETYVVISMQPLSDMKNRSAATHRQLLMCSSRCRRRASWEFGSTIGSWCVDDRTAAC